MKKHIILSATASLMLASLTVSCESEKDLVIYDGNLTIKTNTLYMVGDATPCGWSIDAPEPLIQSEEDSSIFTWEGTLYQGEVKFVLAPGSWDNPFIRPIVHGEIIGKDEIVDQEFTMYAGDPDNKWYVDTEGRYLLRFDMRKWTISTKYLGEPEGPEVVPIETEDLYIVGSATPAGWNIDDPYKLEKKDKYTFVYDGELAVGEMKAYCVTGEWDADCVRPNSGDVTIGADGVSSPDFVFTKAPDNKWNITAAGIYHLEFDLEHWKIDVKCVEEFKIEPIETANVYMVGEATDAGWNIGNPVILTKKSQYVFEFNGHLNAHKTFKCCTERDIWEQPFIRPNRDNVKVNRDGVEEDKFVYTLEPDNKWLVEVGGQYSITFDLEHYTVKATLLKEDEGQGDEGDELMNATAVYIVGSATPKGWDIGNATALTRDPENDHIFSWTGNLVLDNGNPSEFKACLERDTSWGCAFIRPSSDGVTVSSEGVTAEDFIFTPGDPDYKWSVVEPGKYTITFDLENKTIKVTYLDK